MKSNEIVLKSRSDGRVLFRMYESTALPGNRPYREHHHTECEISAILSGSCRWQIRRMPVESGSGDVLIFGSDEEHYITNISDGDPLKILNIQFEPRFIWSAGGDLFDARYLSIFLNHGPEFENRLEALSDTARQVSALMQQIREECLQSRPEYELIVKAELLLILGQLGRRFTAVLEEPAIRSGAHLQQLETALNYIDDNLTTELTLEEIAQAAGMSRSYFSAVFKKLNGLTVWDYITNKRIQLAVDHIRQGTHSITEIALLCGYNTMANFNRSFKMVTHCTPSQFRKNLLGMEE